MALYLQQSWAFNLADQGTDISNEMNKWSNELTSGMRITQNGDADAYEIYMNQENTATSLTTVKNSLVNSSSALSLAQNSLTSILKYLNQAKQVAIKAEDNTNGTAAYTDLKGNWQSLLQEAQTTANNTKYNGQNLLLNATPGTGTMNYTFKAGLLGSGGTGLIYATDGEGGQDTTKLSSSLAGTGSGTGDLDFTALYGLDMASSGNAKTALEDINSKIAAVQSDLDEVTIGLNKMQSTSENIGAQISTTQKAATNSTQTDYSSAAQSLALVQSRQTTLIGMVKTNVNNVKQLSQQLSQML
ncbi:hypothetical protein [Vibrio marisflavi]|uniref:Flagellin N-terminal domain-containing protein n=1 Tax=Vibrio marisflavi CECT 7928 TaxID=634439 RepID=A0ABN8E5C7_9VIBR|nr:hypothetical protein [Vibrio marisflavi]CAH0540107.1 hypothetical protein VMF7928_02619 [Vibrio marisflavi CECT 7928]